MRFLHFENSCIRVHVDSKEFLALRRQILLQDSKRACFNNPESDHLQTLWYATPKGHRGDPTDHSRTFGENLATDEFTGRLSESVRTGGSRGWCWEDELQCDFTMSWAACRGRYLDPAIHLIDSLTTRKTDNEHARSPPEPHPISLWWLSFPCISQPA